MTDCNLEPVRFPSCKGRLVEASFSGGAITSDGGAVLLRQADRMLGLTDRAAHALTDTRRKASCRYSLLTMVRQRVYALALGYEDLNDHDELRSDPALQTAVDADETLAGASTLCRFEQGMGRADAVCLHEALVDRFIASFPRPPRRLVLDFDATDDPVHGMQEGRFFHGSRPLLLSAPVRVLRRPAAGGLAASGQQRRRPARLGDSGLAGKATAPGLAEGGDRVPRRQRILSAAHAVVNGLRAHGQSSKAGTSTKTMKEISRMFAGDSDRLGAADRAMHPRSRWRRVHRVYESRDTPKPLDDRRQRAAICDDFEICWRSG